MPNTFAIAVCRPNDRLIRSKRPLTTYGPYPHWEHREPRSAADLVRHLEQHGAPHFPARDPTGCAPPEQKAVDFERVGPSLRIPEFEGFHLQTGVSQRRTGWPVGCIRASGGSGLRARVVGPPGLVAARSGRRS
jgi:hypothetical protein